MYDRLMAATEDCQVFMDSDFSILFSSPAICFGVKQNLSSNREINKYSRIIFTSFKTSFRSSPSWIRIFAFVKLMQMGKGKSWESCCSNILTIIYIHAVSEYFRFPWCVSQFKAKLGFFTRAHFSYLSGETVIWSIFDLLSCSKIFSLTNQTSLQKKWPFSRLK